MEKKWIDYITQLTIIGLVLVLAFTIDRVIKLNERVSDMEVLVKDLQERTLNHEYRLEDIMPNDDIPHNFN